MYRFVITARLREGSAETVAQILREGPPFVISETSLDRHEVFLSEDEVVFLFEGSHAEDEAMRLQRAPQGLHRRAASATTSTESLACPWRSSAGSARRTSMA